MLPVLMAKVHTNPNKKVKASHKMRTAQEENLHMSQVNRTPAMAMTDMEETPIEMTTGDTGIEHQVSQVCTTTMAMQMQPVLLLRAGMSTLKLKVMIDHLLAATTTMMKSSMAS